MKYEVVPILLEGETMLQKVVFLILALFTGTVFAIVLSSCKISKPEEAATYKFTSPHSAPSTLCSKISYFKDEAANVCFAYTLCYQGSSLSAVPNEVCDISIQKVPQ